MVDGQPMRRRIEAGRHVSHGHDQHATLDPRTQHIDCALRHRGGSLADPNQVPASVQWSSREFCADGTPPVNGVERRSQASEKDFAQGHATLNPRP
jgi:hypothetical protein